MKHMISHTHTPMVLSHPAGVRGLKLNEPIVPPLETLSHPAGVRGLKLSQRHLSATICSVAPRRGAWIETGRGLECR